VTKAAEPSRKCKRCYSGLENSNASFAIAALISELNSVIDFATATVHISGDVLLGAVRIVEHEEVALLDDRFDVEQAQARRRDQARSRTACPRSPSRSNYWRSTPPSSQRFGLVSREGSRLVPGVPSDFTHRFIARPGPKRT